MSTMGARGYFSVPRGPFVGQLGAQYSGIGYGGLAIELCKIQHMNSSDKSDDR